MSVIKASQCLSAAFDSIDQWPRFDILIQHDANVKATWAHAETCIQSYGRN